MSVCEYSLALLQNRTRVALGGAAPPEEDERVFEYLTISLRLPSTIRSRHDSKAPPLTCDQEGHPRTSYTPPPAPLWPRSSRPQSTAAPHTL
ncbi:hypothetical protein E2C01_011527 [Portunus trituberculatus]|uniref:Uncharacterized protein n=1 Tax=Portunus trituberculatus TaxID=210409 RepID=A0A5B7DBP1_PORTR|nr:hypothetical protein [Portunus trituberculatus]